MLERIIFNILAFSLFTIIFFKMIRKNDTNYIGILILEALGIAIGFIELLTKSFFGNFIRYMTYFISICIPIVIIILEKNQINYMEHISLFLAKTFHFFHKDKQTKAILIKLIHKNPESYMAHKMLGKIYEKEGGMRKAIDEYVMAIDMNKKDYETYYNIAFLLDKLGKRDESIEMLGHLIDKKPDYYEASEFLGKLLCEQENFKEAINVYMNALKYNPDNYDIYYNMGIAYTRLNDFQNAKICYEKAAEINSMLYNGYYNLGIISLLYDDLDEAEKYFMEALKGEDVEPESYYHLSRIYAIKGEKEKAINYLNLAVQLDPTLSKKAIADPVFIPIQRFIPQNVNMQNYDRTIKMKLKEKKAKEHLENTFYIVGKISKNDLKKMHTYQEKDIRIEEKGKELEN